MNKELVIPAYLQSTAYVSDVSFSLFALASELSTDDAHAVRAHTTPLGATCVRTYHVRRDVKESACARMFSARVAQSHGVPFGASDTRVFAKVLPGNAPGALHVPVVLTPHVQRSNDDELQPYGHIPCERASSASNVAV